MSAQAARATAMTRLLFVLQPADGDEVAILAEITKWPLAAQQRIAAMIDRQLDRAREGVPL